MFLRSGERAAPELGSAATQQERSPEFPVLFTHSRLPSYMSFGQFSDGIAATDDLSVTAFSNTEMSLKR